MNWIDRLKAEYNKGDSPVRKLIFINVAAFALFALLRYVLGKFESNADPSVYFMVSSEFGKVLIRPWSVLTYQFLHSGLWHILFNMIILYLFGNIYLNFQNRKSFYWLYFGSGVLGALVFLLLYNVFPIFEGQKAVLLGASGSIMGVVAATALLVPDYEVRLFGAFNVRLKWIAIFLLGSGILFMDPGNEGGRFAHLGGALFGALFMLERQGKVNLNLELFDRVGSWFRRKKGPDEKDILRKKTYRSKPQYTTVNADQSEGGRQRSRKSGAHPRQEEIDAILDKISLSGYESLTAEEKETLFRASQ